ncbi:MAG: hypothetical protein FJ291_11955 [Planctomycetes bacterium]|nr:hypothetical protein [Planctomycetota bacterium]
MHPDQAGGRAEGRVSFSQEVRKEVLILEERLDEANRSRSPQVDQWLDLLGMALALDHTVQFGPMRKALVSALESIQSMRKKLERYQLPERQ